MSREIKFRAWDKVYKRMVYVLNPIIHGEVDIFNFNFLKNYDCNYECMQFTGLLDKNGKEIWEGDILKSETMETLMPVKWYSDSAGFNLVWIKGHNVEVISNIYKNPELIKK